MFEYWYRPLKHYPYGHPDYWRVRLIFHMLLVAVGLFIVTATTNFFVFDDNFLGLLDTVGAVSSFVIYLWFRKTGNIEIAAWTATIVFSFLVMVFIYSVQGDVNSIVWATLIPPVAFFLLGKTWGTVVTSVVMSFCCYVSFTIYQQQPASSYSFGLVLNLAIVSLGHVVMFRFYEGTRADAYQNLASSHAQIKRLAQTDRLTNLYNREKFELRFSELLADDSPTSNELCIALIDIDHFKLINDQHGHLTGDRVLKFIADHLKSQMREQDLLARWGGEEFVVLMENTNIQQAAQLAERLRKYIESLEVETHKLTISIGLAGGNKSASLQDVLSRADGALYKAKQSGRNQLVLAG